MYFQKLSTKNRISVYTNSEVFKIAQSSRIFVYLCREIGCKFVSNIALVSLVSLLFVKLIKLRTADEIDTGHPVSSTTLELTIARH